MGFVKIFLTISLLTARRDVVFWRAPARGLTAAQENCRN